MKHLPSGVRINAGRTSAFSDGSDHLQADEQAHDNRRQRAAVNEDVENRVDDALAS